MRFPDPRPRQQVQRPLRRCSAAAGSGSSKTPVRAPQANAIAEWFIRTVCAECLDWLLIANRGHLERVLRVHVEHYNAPRPHRAQAPATATAEPADATMARPVATTASAASSTGTTETPLEARKPTMAPVRDAVLLERLARRRRPRLGQVAKEVRLGGRDARDPLDVARSGTALQGVGDRLEGGLIDVERPAPRALARSMIRSLSSRIRCSTASTPGSALFALAVAAGVRVRAPAGFAARAVDLVVRDPAAVRRFCCPAVAFFGCGIAASLCCAFANPSPHGREPF